MTAPTEPLADFEQEMMRYLPHVARYARSLTHDTADADDLVQETFLLAWRARATFLPGSDGRRWMFAICRNEFFRRHRRGQRVVSVGDAPELDSLASAQLHNRALREHTANIMDAPDIGPAIEKAMDTLSPAFREVVALVDVGGADYAEAAAALDVPIGTVRSRLFRARRLLQEMLLDHARDLGLVPGVVQETA